MQRLSGLLLMLAGTSLGVYMYLPAPKDGAEKLAEMTRISAAPDRDVRAAIPAQTNGTFADLTTASLPEPATSPAPAGFVADKAGANSAANKWSAVVTAQAVNAPKLSSSKPGDDQTRDVLTRDLQKELARVGCYHGEVNGAWTPSTKRAMSDFMDRVNATLPVDEPDYILLTLVQGHTAEACGVDCPSGQAMSAVGRCVPQAVIAQAQKKSQRDERRRVAEVRKAEQARQTAARRGEERQRLATLKDRQTSNQASRTTVAAAEPEILPWQKDSVPAGAATDEIGQLLAARREPPPGMMSIGGPEVTHPQIPASASITAAPGPAPIAPAPVAAVVGDEPKLALAEPADDNEISSAAPALKAPRPHPAERKKITPQLPVAQQQGLPGTKAGVSVRPMKPSAKFVRRQMLPPRRIVAVRRPLPMPAYYLKPQVKYYAAVSKPRRGQPRPGTMRYNVMQSLGGIY